MLPRLRHHTGPGGQLSLPPDQNDKGGPNVKRIWLNHWFSTAYNIIRLIRDSDPGYTIIGTNENEESPIKAVCDEWYRSRN